MELFIKRLFLLFFVCVSSFSYSQGRVCQEAEPFCASDESFVFPNTTGGQQAESGPDYGCLDEVPNPAWYFIRINQSGILNFNIVQNTQADFMGIGIDVDFIAYGPFNSTNVCNSGNLSSQNTVACSYSFNSTENFTINNAIEDEIYILLITNFDNSPGFIKLEQTNLNTNGAGGTDCSIVNTLNYCEGEIVALDATTSNATSYVWYNESVILTETGSILSNIASLDATYTAETYDMDGSIISTIEFIVDFHTVPVANSIPNQEVCDDNNGFRTFNLTALNATALGGQSALDNTVAYHTSQADADNDSNELPNTYTNQVAYTAEEIFVRVENNDNTDCYSVSSFNLIVNPPPTITTIPDYEICDTADDGDETNGFAMFDLTTQDNALINGQNTTILYFESQNEANSNNNSIINPAMYMNTTANSQTIYFRLENIATMCENTGSFDIVVNTLPETQNSILIQCDEDGMPDGFTVYNLDEANENVMINGDTAGFNYTHHLNSSDAQSGNNPVNPFPFRNTANPQTIHVRVENATTGCFKIAEYVLGVTATDIADTNLRTCDDNYDGFAEFTLSDANDAITAALPMGLNVAYYATANDAQLEVNQLSNNYTNTQPSRQTIYARVENANACFGIASIDVIVDPLPENNSVNDFVICSSTPSNPEINLTQFDGEVLGTQNPANFTVTYYESQNEADTATNALLGPYTNTNNPQTLYVRVENNITGCYTTTVNFEIVVIDANPIITAIVTTPAFADWHNIQAMVSTNTVNILSIYEFSLDDGPWESNDLNSLTYTFTNVTAGEHIIRVRDTFGCGENTTIVTVLDYPLFFTPNDDGHNDLWNIFTIKNQPDAVIYVYNRYGKLLKQLSPNGNGWDGTYNGNLMPSSDYWFTVNYRDPNTDKKKSFTSHFTLKQ